MKILTVSEFKKIIEKRTLFLIGPHSVLLKSSHLSMGDLCLGNKHNVVLGPLSWAAISTQTLCRSILEAALSHRRTKQKHTELISLGPGDLESQRLKKVSLEQN